MARIILKSKYLKPSSSEDRGGFIGYIATRSGTVMNMEQLIHVQPTEKQKELIENLVNEFPSIKLQKEYKDFKEHPSVASATELIDSACEEKYGQISKKEDFISYIAERPGVVKRGVHGLFSIEDEPIVLEHVKDQIKEHSGNIWTHVLSLRREDAELTGFDIQEAWVNLLRKNHFKMAEAMKIEPQYFHWYAAFHDTAYHPHVHIVMYSSDENQGYLTNKGIESMKRVFATDIFRQELNEIYIEKDKVKQQLKQEIQNLTSKLEKVPENQSLNDLMIDLSKELKTYQGKKTYGYLPKRLKSKVNRIMVEVEKMPEVKELLEKWRELIHLQHSIYSSDPQKEISFISDKTFRSLKNQIIQEAVSLNLENDQSTATVCCTFSLLRHLSKVFKKNAGVQGNDLKSDKAVKLNTKLQKMALGQNENDTQQFG